MDQRMGRSEIAQPDRMSYGPADRVGLIFDPKVGHRAVM